MGTSARNTGMVGTGGVNTSGVGIGDGGIPGPGNYDGALYDIKMRGGISYKFDKSERQVETDKNPGPGYYYVPVTFADVPRYVLPE